MQSTEPEEPEQNHGKLPESITTVRERVMGSARLQTAFERVVIAAFATMLYTSPVIAQSAEEQSVSMCTTGGYNFVVAAVLAFCGICAIIIVGSSFGGGAMKAVGFISSKISRMGNHALVGSMAAFGLIALVLGIAAVGWSVVPVSIPTECVTFF